MNFLGHLYLATIQPHSLVGSILPDLCKPRDWRQQSPAVIQGCMMHQQVDRLIDANPHFLALKKTVSTPRKRFAGIILDVALDHYLAANWSEWHDTDLRQFVDQCYNRMVPADPQLPEQVHRVLAHMVAHDWLYHYRHVSGIASAYQGLSRRFRFENPLAGSEQEWINNQEQWEQGFHKIMTDMVQHDFKQLTANINP